MDCRVDVRIRCIQAAALLSSVLAPTVARSDARIRAAAHAVREVTCMGVVLRLSVLNLRQYRVSFLPAYRAAESGRDLTAFTQMLRSALADAPDARPPAVDPHVLWEEPEVKRRYAEAEEAKKQGDLAPSHEFWAMINEKLASPTQPPLIKREILDALRLLESDTATATEKIRIVREIGPELAEQLCKPWTRVRNPSFNLTRSDLTDILKSSDELDPMLSGIGLTGGRLEVTRAGDALVFSRTDLERLVAELAKVRRPLATIRLEHECGHFRELVDLALSTPDYALVLTSD
jgi:hypothetical protein